jgi:rhamnosyltransferase
MLSTPEQRRKHVLSAPPPASVIVRTKDSARTLRRVLWLLRAQTAPCEIIVVDSGSRDATLAIAREMADRQIEMPAERFTFGGALNMGAALARAGVHFALSSHSFPPDDRWIERSLSLYDRKDVAGTNGAMALPGSHAPLRATFYQTLADVPRDPCWGYSNTGSSWRAEVWAEHPFDEELPACEDKQWGLRVLRAGWVLAFDPRLCVTDAHRTTHGIGHLYRRTRREFEALGSFAPAPPVTLRDFLAEWLTDLPGQGARRRWRHALNHVRFTELVAKHRGLRAGQALANRSRSARLTGEAAPEPRGASGRLA